MSVLKIFLARMSCVVCAISMATLLSGCGGPGGQGGTTAQQEKPKHPHLKFHRPKTLDQALQRLTVIHESVNGEGELPPPVTFEYVEVIHGKGPSAHSHFYMAENFDSAMEHEEEEEHQHEDEHEAIERHTSVIDFRTEFGDVVKWLPDVAAAADLDSTNWQSVSDVSKKMNQVLESIPADPQSPKLRDSWKQKSSEIEAMLTKLQETCAAASGDGK